MVFAYYYTSGDREEINHFKEEMNQLNIYPCNQFIDKDRQDDKFDRLLEQIKYKDKLWISSFANFAPDHTILLNRLEHLRELDVSLIMHLQKEIPVDIILNFLYFYENSKKHRAKVRQQEGIQKALHRGGYGRPKIKMPVDFEENIIKIVVLKEKSHTLYRKQCGLKKGTYYTLVKQVRESWNDKEISMNDKVYKNYVGVKCERTSEL